MEESFKYVSSLSGKRLKALKWYTTKEYREFNTQIRGHEYLSTDNIEKYNIFLDIFRDAPRITEPIVVFRGVTQLEHIVPDDVSIVSTSSEREVGIDFAREADAYDKPRCCLLKITIPAGSVVLPIEKISNAPDEKEILLPPGGRFKLISKEPVVSSVVKTYYLSYEPEIAVNITGQTIEKALTKTKTKTKKTKTIEKDIFQLAMDLVESIDEQEKELYEDSAEQLAEMVTIAHRSRLSDEEYGKLFSIVLETLND